MKIKRIDVVNDKLTYQKYKRIILENDQELTHRPSEFMCLLADMWDLRFIFPMDFFEEMATIMTNDALGYGDNELTKELEEILKEDYQALLSSNRVGDFFANLSE